MARWCKQRIVAIYAKHNPPKLLDVDSLLFKYAGRETALLRNSCDKYGVERMGPQFAQAPAVADGRWARRRRRCLPAMTTPETLAELGFHAVSGSTLFSRGSEG